VYKKLRLKQHYQLKTSFRVMLSTNMVQDWRTGISILPALPRNKAICAGSTGSRRNQRRLELVREMEISDWPY
jgi:hypothetical protein